MLATDVHGLGVAMITPFQEDQQIDFKSLEKLTEHIISGGADYLVVCGTTGETPTLSANEKKEVLKCIAAVNNKRLPIVFGAGGNNTMSAVQEIADLDTNLVDAVLAVVPYYNKPTQQGMYEHFKYIAERSALPLMLYNIPGRTGVNMAAETTLRLANEFDNIIAVKEASGDLDQMEFILKNKPEGFAVVSGDDALTIDLVKKGGVGIVSVIGNALTKEFKGVVTAALEGRFEDAEKLNEPLKIFYKLLFVDGNPAGVKVLANAKGLCSNVLRLPLMKATPNTEELLLKALANL